MIDVDHIEFAFFHGCSYNEIPAGIGVETTGVIGGAVVAAV